MGVVTRSRARRLPTRSASAWLWLDGLSKLGRTGKIATLGILACLILIIAAYWWAFLTGVVILIGWRMYLRHVERSRARGSIPFGKLGLVEWLACRVIEVAEGVLRRHNTRRGASDE